jgi:spore germination protein GerM
MQDNGASGPAVGCGDSAVAVQVSVPYTQAVLRAAMEHLLSIKDQYYGQSGLYNALYESTLSVDNVRLDGRTVVVELSGQLTMGGECDIPRVEAQLTQTALQFSTVDQAKIFINGKPLKEVLSLK